MVDRAQELEDRLVALGATVSKIAIGLPSNRLGTHISNQLIRCGTSPAPNYAEARTSESRRDFIHKMKIALKELRETIRWIKLAQRVPLVDKRELVDSLREENDELIRIFVASINTAGKKKERTLMSLQLSTANGGESPRP